MQAIIYNDGKHSTVLLIRRAHKLRRFIERSPQPERERRAGGRSSRGYLHVEGRECSTMRHLLLVVWLGPQSHAWGSCPWRKPSGAGGVQGEDQGRRQDPRRTRSRSGAHKPVQQTAHRGETWADPLRPDLLFYLATSDKLAHSNHCLQLTNTTHTEIH